MAAAPVAPEPVEGEEGLNESYWCALTTLHWTLRTLWPDTTRNQANQELTTTQKYIFHLFKHENLSSNHVRLYENCKICCSLVKNAAHNTVVGKSTTAGWCAQLHSLQEDVHSQFSYFNWSFLFDRTIKLTVWSLLISLICFKKPWYSECHIKAKVSTNSRLQNPVSCEQASQG